MRNRLLRFVCAVALIGAVSRGSGAESPVKSSQFGAERHDFALDCGKGFVIVPPHPAGDSAPWVWYAPTFIGQHPDDSHEWMAKQLLAAGFYIAGVDVGESYGSPAGTTAYTRFYETVTNRYKLSPKACLLAQSRGGLMLLNWAIANTTRVQCIAGIYAVCSIESYPGVEKAAPAYGLEPHVLQERLVEFNPLPRAGALAAAGIPMCFIHGSSDVVVPIQQNSKPLVEGCRAAGGRAELIVVPGKGHQVCPEFFQSEQLTEFLLRKGEADTN